MIRRRLYNPAQLTPEELKESFTARQDILERMLELLGGQECDSPCQHMMLVGPRGMGKTTLGLRFLCAVAESPGLAAEWQPVPFHEESYGIGDLADFWLTALRHLTRATEDPRWANRADAFLKDEGDPRRLAAYARAALSDFCRESGKRPILFVENLDAVLVQFRNEREVHSLRASLIERPDLLLIGSANTIFGGIRSHGEPFYEFFRLFVLPGLTTEETLQMVAAFAGAMDRPEVPAALTRDRGRLETIRRLTGGNPRLMVLACQILIESPLGDAFEILERLIDEQTPYFKARIEELPTQARMVFYGVAEGWTPMLAREVAHAIKLDSSHASAQLRLLAERNYVRVVRLPHERKPRYEIADRFFNIYVLLRFARGSRERLENLVAFLQDLFGLEAMRTISPENGEAGPVRMQDTPRTEEAEDHSRRAAVLFPDTRPSPSMDSGIPAGRGEWKDALKRLEKALQTPVNEGGDGEWSDLIASLIWAVVANQGQTVRVMMERTGADRMMEPLWHAVRADLGEELEPLPAEIMDATNGLLEELARNRG